MTSDYKPAAAVVHGHKLPPKSYVVVWNKNKPEVRETHWQVGYTAAHRATPQEALAHAGVELLSQVANVREKWVYLQMAGAHLTSEALTNAFGQILTPTSEESEDAATE